jgi:cytochrome c peroxidase
VLFYDVNLSRTKNISCASCHAQSLAFGDTAVLSLGIDGVSRTGAHSMRLGNARFNESGQYFWNKRAASLEAQTTQPIQDEVEMGFDATHGGFAAVVARLDSLPYYGPLFKLAFGSDNITEVAVQRALAQYVRSILAINSRWDVAFATVPMPPPPGGPNFLATLPGFTAQESRGQQLFFQPKNAGGAGCQGCHAAPSFSLAANSLSNGLDAGQTTVFRSPSLKDVGRSAHFMHDGRFDSLEEVVEFYNSGIQDGPQLDNRLRGPGGGPQRLNLSASDKAALAAFLRTLNDQSLSADPKFSNPFRP